jgi:hypothetical protein
MPKDLYAQWFTDQLITAFNGNTWEDAAAFNDLTAKANMVLSEEQWLTVRDALLDAKEEASGGETHGTTR